MKKVSYNSTDVASLSSKVSKCFEISKSHGWNQVRLSLMGKTYSEKDFNILISNVLFNNVEVVKDYSWNWYKTELLVSLMNRFPDYTDHIVENCNDWRLAREIISSGVIQLEAISKFSDSPSKDVRKAVASICDFDTLEKLAKDKVAAVRKVAFARLGPVGYLDDMLSDKSASIRGMGVDFAPMSYHKLSLMTNEISRNVFSGLVKKIPRGDLPLLLSNRNLKDRYCSGIFQARMESGL